MHIIKVYSKSVITFITTARTNEDIITALTEVIAGIIFPQIALASIAKIIASPINTAFMLISTPTP
jgi:hypothetical protein